jgi:hypothetical protein
MYVWMDGCMYIYIYMYLSIYLSIYLSVYLIFFVMISSLVLCSNNISTRMIIIYDNNIPPKTCKQRCNYLLVGSPKSILLLVSLQMSVLNWRIRADFSRPGAVGVEGVVLALYPQIITDGWLHHFSYRFYWKIIQNGGFSVNIFQKRWGLLRKSSKQCVCFSSMMREPFRWTCSALAPQKTAIVMPRLLYMAYIYIYVHIFFLNIYIYTHIYIHILTILYNLYMDIDSALNGCTTRYDFKNG